MLKEIIYALILLMAVPAGWLLAWLCNDELVKDRKYLIILAGILALSFVLIAVLSPLYAKTSMLLSAVFMIIAVSVMIALSYNKKFVKNN